MRDKLVVVFGGGGFLGRYVVQALLRAGARVRIAQRDPRQAWYLKAQGGLGQTQFVGADVTRPDTVLRAVGGADMAVNLVGVLDGDFDAVHVAGARAIAEAAARTGLAALVHVSAIGADPAAEARYARSKGDGEAAVRSAFPNATVLRPSVVFGPEDRFVNRFAAMLRWPVVPVLRAAARFQPVYAGDVAEAVGAALSNPERRGGRTYELGGPEVFTMGAMVRWLADATDRSPAIVELPDFAGAAIARAGFLPGAPITWDQWLMLGRDAVAGEDGLAALGVAPTPLGAVAPGWLVRYRKRGRWGRRALEDAA